MTEVALWISPNTNNYGDRTAMFSTAVSKYEQFHLSIINDTNDLSFSPEAYDLVFAHESDIKHADLEDRLYNPIKATVILFTGALQNAEIKGRSLLINYFALAELLDGFLKSYLSSGVFDLQLVKSHAHVIAIRTDAGHARLCESKFKEIISFLAGLHLGEILFADDEIPKALLKNNYPNLLLANGIEKAKELIDNSPNLKLAIIDLHFAKSPQSGFDILSHLPKGAKSIMLTGYDGFRESLDAWKHGADFFISKYLFSLEHFKAIVKLIQMDDAPLLIGKSQAMQELWKRIASFGSLKQDILISGESGTGKELVAKAVYSLSVGNQAANPYLAINCSAIPETLFESILYGHRKGSFTGAIIDQRGYLEMVKQGVLFLDEISELPEAQQAKLLRTLQEKSFTVLGSVKPLEFKGRLLYGTNRDLDSLVQTKLFRQDLYYRVLGTEIRVPPLRDHKEDIEMLAAYFAFRFIRQNQISAPPDFSISEAELEKLTRYHYPGNIRELEKIVIKACAEAILNNTSSLDFDLPVAKDNPNGHSQAVSSPSQLDMLVELLRSGMIGSRGLSDETKLNLMRYLKNKSYTLRKIADLMGINEQSLRNLKSKHKTSG